MGPVKFVQINAMGSINLAQIIEKILSKSHGDQSDGFSEIREDRRDGFYKKKLVGNLSGRTQKKNKRST